MGCKEKDEIYERPSWLENPAYQVLESLGRFSSYLQCVDRTEYAKVLKGAGLYTVFAPNDEAFNTFLQKKSYTSVTDIPDDEVKKIVAYSIVYSKWTSEHLADKFVDNLYVTGAFKRKTAYYTLPYRDPGFNNNWVFDETGNGSVSYIMSNYQVLITMQNYKYLPVFSAEYFNSFPIPLTASDYNTFFPNSAYNGKNVQDGVILTENIPAENGIIHEVSTVNEPMNNMDIVLQQNEQYSKFKSLLDFKQNDEYVYKVYVEAPQELLDEVFKKMMPDSNITQLYIKSYGATGIAFSPIADNIYSESTGTYDSESNGYTLFVPTNTVLDEYINKRLLRYYTRLEDMPTDIIGTLINTHMSENLIWPSFFQGSLNSTGEYLNGEGNMGSPFDGAGILDKKMASNGFIYLIDHVLKSRFFETVYSEIYLNPSHSLLNRAYVNFYINGLREDLMKCVLNGYTSERYTMLNFSDKILTDDGFSYNSVSSQFEHKDISDQTICNSRLQRLIRSHIFPGLKNSEINSEIVSFDDLPEITQYEGWKFINNLYGDVVRYKNNQMQAAGNIEDETFVTLTQVNDTFNNGQVYNVDKLLQYSPRETSSGDGRFKDLTLWQYLSRARTQNPNVSIFVNYVERCLKTNPDANDLDGIKAENFYTVLMPTNSAMNTAISNGLIQVLDSVNTNHKEYLAEATRFVNSHFLQGTVYPDDGLPYLYPVNPLSPNRALISTLLKINDEALDLTNERTFIEVSKTASGLLNFVPQNITLGSKILVTGTTSGLVRVTRGGVLGSTVPNNFRSNRIACKAVLHEVNNYITFTLSNP